MSLMASGFGCTVLIAALTLVGTAAPAPPPKAAAPEPPPTLAADRVDAAIQAGAAFLVTQQQSNGAIADTARFPTALTSLAGLALLGAGHSPVDKSPEGVALRRAIYFVLRADRQTADGYFGSADASVMHGHAVTTLFLCELARRNFDPEQNDLIRRKATAGHNFILTAQGAAKAVRGDIGGWRYRPDARDSDMPVTAWQLLALHAGAKAGFSVPPRNGQAAAQYLKNVFAAGQGVFDYGPKPVLVSVATEARQWTTTNVLRRLISRRPVLASGPRGGTCYECHYQTLGTNIVDHYVPPNPNWFRPPDSMLQPGGPRNHFSTSAMGLLGLRICGQPGVPEARLAANFLLDWMRLDPAAKTIATGAWPFHGTLFNTLALHNFTEPHASLARQFAERNFVVGQAPDGSWTDSYEGRHIGRVYCTSLALLSLEAKHRRLAIFEVP